MKCVNEITVTNTLSGEFLQILISLNPSDMSVKSQKPKIEEIV